MSRLTGGHLVVACLLLCDSFLFSFSPPPPPHDENNPEKSRGREKVDYNYYICFPIFPPRGRFSDLFPFFSQKYLVKTCVL
jgi:hypothetical protein